MSACCREAMPTAGVSLEQLGLLMGGMHGAENAAGAHPEAREVAYAH